MYYTFKHFGIIRQDINFVLLLAHVFCDYIFRKAYERWRRSTALINPDLCAGGHFSPKSPDA
jgi:hypothetical protein